VNGRIENNMGWNLKPQGQNTKVVGKNKGGVARISDYRGLNQFERS